MTSQFPAVIPDTARGAPEAFATHLVPALAWCMDRAVVLRRRVT